VTSRTCFEIPEYNTEGFYLRIGRPFGADVIQIIACTEDNALHRKLTQMAQETPKFLALPQVPRRLVVEEVNRIGRSAWGQARGAQPRWSEARLVVCTYPKEGR
jgi:hypothetical protein